jgi:hypothetical protein
LDWLAVTKTPQSLTIEIAHQFINYIAKLISAQKVSCRSSFRTVVRLKRDSRPYLCGGRSAFRQLRAENALCRDQALPPSGMIASRSRAISIKTLSILRQPEKGAVFVGDGAAPLYQCFS